MGVTQKLLELAVQQNVKRFVFISSIIVYDHCSAVAGHVFHEDMPYEELEQTCSFGICNPECLMKKEES